MGARLLRFGFCALIAVAVLAASGCSRMAALQNAVAPSGTASNSGGPGAAPGTTSSSSDRLVIKNVAMEMTVGDLAGTLVALRAEALKVGGSISQLSVDSNTDSVVAATAHPATETVAIPGPADASLTLRVPADKLQDVELVTSSLGSVTSQSSDESDVTQKHIDLSAHLANAQAEETRLRALLARAGTVSDLLQVERELSRVQGDVESMQAQLAYLNDQIQMATVKLSLHEPGPVTAAWVGGWGFGQAVTQGVQGGSDVLKGLVTFLLTLSPILLLGWLAVWLSLRFTRRRKSHLQPPIGQTESGQGHGDPPGPVAPR
jgi:hypothetical protein